MLWRHQILSEPPKQPSWNPRNRDPLLHIVHIFFLYTPNSGGKSVYFLLSLNPKHNFVLRRPLEATVLHVIFFIVSTSIILRWYDVQLFSTPLTSFETHQRRPTCISLFRKTIVSWWLLFCASFSFAVGLAPPTLERSLFFLNEPECAFNSNSKKPISDHFN